MLEELVTNGSFEDGTFGEQSPTGMISVMKGDSATIPGWTVFADTGDPDKPPVIWAQNNNPNGIKTAATETCPLRSLRRIFKVPRRI